MIIDESHGRPPDLLSTHPKAKHFAPYMFFPACSSSTKSSALFFFSASRVASQTPLYETPLSKNGDRICWVKWTITVHKMVVQDSRWKSISTDNVDISDDKLQFPVGCFMFGQFQTPKPHFDPVLVLYGVRHLGWIWYRFMFWLIFYILNLFVR